MIKRTIKKQILESIKHSPVTLVTGARQVGKSTLCYEIKKELGYGYVSLDEPRERKLALEDPEMFLQIHECPLIIDEIQYAPGLFNVMESIVNKEKLEKGSNNGMFVIAGSEAYELMKGISESMAGRVSIIRMSPLSVREILSSEESEFVFDLIALNKRSKDYSMNANTLFSLITRGMYPELHANTEIKNTVFYSNYVSTYLERDISNLINVKDKLKFQNFIEVLASITGEELVYDTIAKAVGIKIDTVKSWISVLLAGDIIYLLQPYNELSIMKRIVKRPKIYFNDTGLACYLAGINDATILKNSIFKGRFVETYIVNELRKNYLNNGIRPNFYYYRDNNQNEIDLVILKDGKLHFIECKSGVEFSQRDVKGFDQLSKSNYEIGCSFIICNTPTVYKIKDNVYAIPITSI